MSNTNHQKRITTSFSYLESPNGKISCVWCNKPFKKMKALEKHNVDKHLGMIRIDV